MTALLLTLNTGTVYISKGVNETFLKWDQDKYDGFRLDCLLKNARQVCHWKGDLFSVFLPRGEEDTHHFCVWEDERLNIMTTEEISDASATD